jgi:hypothetical protein
LINHSRRKKSTPTNQTPKLSRKERLASLAQKERALIDALPSLIGEKSLLFGGVSAKLNSGKLSNTDDNSKRFVNRKESLKEYPPLTSQKSPAAASPKLPVVQAPIVTPPAVVVVSAEERLKEVEQPPTKSALSKSQFYPQNGTEYTGSTIFAIDIAKRFDLIFWIFNTRFIHYRTEH